MSTVAEFVLKFREMMSGGLQKMANTAQSAFKVVDNNITRSQARMNLAGKSIQDLNTRLDMLTKVREINVDTKQLRLLNSEIERTEKQLNKLQTMGMRGGGTGSGGGGLTFGGMVGANLFSNVMMRGMEYSKNLITSTLQQGMDVERTIVGLSTFVGDAQAKAIYKQLQDEAPYTPYTSNKLLTVERAMIPFKSIKESHDVMMALANAVAGTGGTDFDFERVGKINMQHIAAQGYMSGIQRREFMSASIPIMPLLAKSFFPKMNQQKAIAKLNDMEGDGKISFNMVAKALEDSAKPGGMFYGAMEKLSQTIYGKWTTIQDYWQQAQAKITLSQANPIKAFEDKIIEKLKALPDWVDKHQKQIENFTKGLIHIGENIMKAAGWVYDNWGWLKYVAEVWLFLNVLNKVILPIRGLITAFTALEGVLGGSSIAFTLGAISSALVPFVAGLAGVYALVKMSERPQLQNNDVNRPGGVSTTGGKSFYDTRSGKWVNVGGGSYEGSLKEKLDRDIARANKDKEWTYGGTTYESDNSKVSGVKSADDVNAAMVGSGQKVINMYFQKSIVDKIEIHAKEVREGVGSMKMQVEQVMAEILASAGVALK